MTATRCRFNGQIFPSFFTLASLAGRTKASAPTLSNLLNKTFPE
jgi:hypothetical protein